ncbi:hypothetical protein ATCC90586_007422 [Pythium insidiosum]|nr:hypothetical protein ATCC90586_007422 [Pythium insidiosum]
MPMEWDDGVERSPLLKSHGEEQGDGVADAPPSARAPLRLRRTDLACLSIVGIVASFLLIWQPVPRPDNPFWPSGTPDASLASLDADASAFGGKQEPFSEDRSLPAFKYMTYDDITPEKRKKGYSVTYSQRGFQIDGRWTLLLGGSIHYPRSTPAMWEDLLLKAKNDGLNHIELYVFWSLHEPTPDSFVLEGRANITHFYDLAAKLGLFLNVRFGPYACAEWNKGGLPVWLDWIPGMNVRSSAAPWKREMRRFLEKMVDLSRPYLAKNGGPIVLAQIENEYNDNDQPYVDWCGEVVKELDTDIPWIMCNGRAANNTILACNGDDCVEEGFAASQTRRRPNEPFMWTENEGWYESWGYPRTHIRTFDDRPPEDMAYTVARWISVGGAHHNYYMYHGGNNYGRTASAGVTTMYADGKPIVLGTNLTAFVYANPSGRVVFLGNNNAKTDAVVTFEGKDYSLAAKSIIILKNGKELFNTADVKTSYPHRQRRVYTPLVPASSLKWEAWTEEGTDRKVVVDSKPREQISLTRDESDYLVYKTTFKLSALSHDALQSRGALSLDFIACEANAFHVYVNGHFVVDTYRNVPGDNCSTSFHATIQGHVWGKDAGTKEHELTLVSVSLGLFTLGKFHRKGITGDVVINKEQSIARTGKWTMYPSLVGEQRQIFVREHGGTVPWEPFHPADAARQRFMTWYRTKFRLARPTKKSHSPPVEETTAILLDGLGLTRGRTFLNGQDLGRHWLIKGSNAKFIQRYYHIPPDWLREDGENDLVLFDELGGSPRDVSIVLSSMVEDVDPTDDEANQAVIAFHST